MITQTTNIQMGLSFDDVLLVPQRTRVKSRSAVDLSSHFTRRIRLHLPIVSSNVDFCTEAAMATAMAKHGGIGVIHRTCTMEYEAGEVRATKNAVFSKEEFPFATVDARGRLLVAAAVGVIGDSQERAMMLVRAGVDVLVVDVAHGHADYVLDVIALLKRTYPHVEVIGGNVATAHGTKDLIEAGADAVKAGIGPGGICTTRIVAGAGVPQITAIVNCVAAARPHGVPVIADGGIRQSGDIAKALAAGASTVMLASILAGADESAAILIERGGRKFKITTGEASLGSKLMLKKKYAIPINEDEIRQYVPEGVDATFDSTGPVADTLAQLSGGLRSGMSYSGASTIEELWEKAEFCHVSAAGLAEGQPHAVVRSTVEQLQPDYRKLNTK